MACMSHWCPKCKAEVSDNQPNAYCESCKCWMVSMWDERDADDWEDGQEEEAEDRDPD